MQLLKVLQVFNFFFKGNIFLYIIFLFQHAGCPSEASKWMDEGRMLDTADRYVNSKCAKYLLRVNTISKATEMCALFTKVCLHFVF